MKNLTTRDRERANLVRGLIELEMKIYGASRQLEALIESLLMGQVIDDISNLVRQKRAKNITVPWLQKTYRVGYTRSGRILDALRAKGVIKKENPRR